MPRIRVFAPAKINLCLHVTGQRPDGYHLLDTLVGFASVGDWVTLDTRQKRGLTIEGPESAALDPAAPNLVMQTAMEFWGKGMGRLGLTLTKHLPVSSGIGGGSADAAATFRGILWVMDHRGKDLPTDTTLVRRLLALGADVPMCVMSDAAHVRGIGEVMTPVALPPLPLLLVNPRVPVPTPAVFKALTRKDNPAPPPLPTDLKGPEPLIRWLQDQRNDLQLPATEIAPVIGTVLHALAALPGCALARMSGSGATCFGIFTSDAEAEQAATLLRKSHPDWWITATRLNSQTRVEPQVIRDTT